MRLLWIAAIAAAVPAVAEAEPGGSAAVAVQRVATYDVGFRVGGYGFRREGDNRPGTGWTECRMNGLGVFASRVVHGPLFVEAGLDLYSSADVPLGAEPTDLPIDRTSGLASVAGGVRTQLAPWLRGYLQLGVGVELTRVAVPYGDDSIRDTQVMPDAFFGIGVDLRVGRKTYLGAAFRTLAMGNFDYSREQLEMKQDWGFTTPPADVVFEPSIDFAAQGQFYVRRDL